MRPALLSIFLVACSAAPVVPSASAPSKESGLEVTDVNGLGLFAEERVKSRQLIAQAVTGRERSVVPYEVTQRAWALAAEGRNPFTGAACGKALAPYQARKRWGAELGVTGTVSSGVWCKKDGSCELSVSGVPLEEGGGEAFHWVASIAPSGDPLGALSDAARALAPALPNKGGGGLGLLGSMGGKQPIQEEDLLRVRVWSADRRDQSKLEDSQAGFPSLTVGQVQTCLSETDSSVTTLLEISPAGGVARCEGDASEDPEAAACLCGQLQRSTPAASLAGKRWTVSVSIDRRDQTTSDRRLVLNGHWNTFLERVVVPGQKFPRVKAKVEDRSIEAWSPGSARLAVGCFTKAFPEPGHLSSRWAVWFDGVGRPTKILEQKGYAPLAKELAECVARALGTAQAPCPARAGLWAMADLSVSARDPNAPPMSLEDALKKQP